MGTHERIFKFRIVDLGVEQRSLQEIGICKLPRKRMIKMSRSYAYEG